MKKKDGFPNEKAIVIPAEIIKTLVENEITRKLYITDIGYYPRARDHYRSRQEGCSQHILIYCHEGEGWYDIGDGQRKVGKNDFFIIEAGTPHIYAASETSPWSIYWIHFTGKDSHVFSPLFNATFNISNSSTARFSDRINLFNEILVNLEMGFGIENMEYISLTLGYLLASFRYIPQYREIKKPSTPDVVQTVIKFMKENLDKPLTLEEVAESVNYSPNYLSSVFTKKTGMPPINYLNQLKIQEACRLLDFSQMKVKEIAFRLAYSDQYYFSKVFTRYMHMSPKEYRLKQKG